MKKIKELQRLKKNFQARIRRYNANVKSLTGSLDLAYDTSLKNIKNKRQLNSAIKAFEKTKSDKIIQNKSGLWLRESDIKRINKEVKQANKRLKQRQQERVKRDNRIARKWGNTKSPIPVTVNETKIPKYTRTADDFKTYKELLDFENRILNAGTKGLHNEDLKQAILKAIRGEVYQQANGFKFRGGEDNVLARFIEKELSGPEVEFFFGGKLNFEYLYSMQEGLLKEMEIVKEIISNKNYPELNKIWEEDYSEEWADFMEYRLNELDPDYAEAYAEELSEVDEYLQTLS